MDFSGYSGWIHNGNCPMTLRCQACRNFRKGNFLYIGGLSGFQDYQYYAVNIGCRFSAAVKLFNEENSR